MDRSAAKAMPQDELIFRDGLGDRFLVRDTQRRPLHETLALRPELTGIPSFEFALNDRMTMLEKFEHGLFVPVRQLVRLPGHVTRLSLVSDHVQGTRLSDFLADREHTSKPLSTGTALHLVREILQAVSALHRQTAGLSHGALAPERILLVDGRIRVAEYTLGSAVEQLRYPPERYWKDLRVAVPPVAGGVRFDRRIDVAQIGMIAIALFASRPLRDSEHIGGVSDVLSSLAHSSGDQHKPLPAPVRGWLAKTLHMDPRRTFPAAMEAEEAFEEAMTEAGVSPAPNQQEFSGSRPRRARTTMTVTAPAPKTMPAAPPAPRPAATAKETMAPLAKPARKDSWDAPGVDARNLSYQAGTLAPTVKPPLFSPKVKGYFKLGLLGVLMAGVFSAAQYIPPPAKLFSTTGTLTVESKPQGVQLLVDGRPQGVTPLTLTLKAGTHEVELRNAGRARVFNVYVTKGDRISQYIEFPASRGRK
jgi:serine/threonine protein kinase